MRAFLVLINGEAIGGLYAETLAAARLQARTLYGRRCDVIG